MGPLFSKPAEMMRFYTGADIKPAKIRPVAAPA